MICTNTAYFISRRALARNTAARDKVKGTGRNGMGTAIWENKIMIAVKTAVKVIVLVCIFIHIVLYYKNSTGKWNAFPSDSNSITKKAHIVNHKMRIVDNMSF